jgi:hypothetical protein
MNTTVVRFMCETLVAGLHRLSPQKVHPGEGVVAADLRSLVFNVSVTAVTLIDGDTGNGLPVPVRERRS